MCVSSILEFQMKRSMPFALQQHTEKVLEWFLPNVSSWIALLLRISALSEAEKALSIRPRNIVTVTQVSEICP